MEVFDCKDLETEKPYILMQELKLFPTYLQSSEDVEYIKYHLYESSNFNKRLTKDSYTKEEYLKMYLNEYDSRIRHILKNFIYELS